VAALALLAALAAPYAGGKYDDDPRLAPILARLPEQRAAARRKLAEALGLEVPEFAVCVEDAGSDRSGVYAETRHVDGKPVVFLKAEYLVLRAFDPEATLVHEFYHCMHRTKLGEKRYARVPLWAREGAALFVAGQGPARAELLAALVARDPLVAAPLERLVDGLGGRHDLYDYFEDVAGFLALGAEKGRALARALLDTEDVARAVRAVTGKDLAAFERAAQAHAQAVLAPLLRRGRDVLAGDRAYFAARGLREQGKDADALARVRAMLAGRGPTTLRPEARLLELELLRALGSPDFEAAAARARRDLEPFDLCADVRRVARPER
jgi:hypothetical protein